MKKLWLILILTAFVLSRLYHLMVMPPFMDELIYIRWLNTIKTTGDWLLPLKEFGWEPLGIWLAGLLNRIFPDPLFSLRLNSLIISVFSLILIIKLFGQLSGFLYFLSPLILLHDRLGLRGDNLVILGALMVYFGLKKQKPVWWGLGIAIGLFSKTTAAALPFVVGLSYLWLRRKIKKSDFLAAGLALLPIIFFLLTGTLNSVINKQEVFIGNPLIKNNLLQIIDWLFHYLTWPILLLSFSGMIVAYRNRLLWLSLLVPLILLVLSAKLLFPRYLLPIFPFLLIYAGIGFTWLSSHLPKILKPFLVIFFFIPAWFSWQILVDFSHAPLSEIDRWQHITGWPSGYGVKELVDYLKIDTPLVLVTETDDLIKTGIAYYWPDHPMIITQTATSGAYLVTNINNLTAGELIKEFFRPENKSAIRLWRLP